MFFDFPFEIVEDTRRIGGIRIEESEFILEISGIGLLGNKDIINHISKAERYSL